MFTSLLETVFTLFSWIPADNVINNHKPLNGYSITDEPLAYNPLRLKGGQVILLYPLLLYVTYSIQEQYTYTCDNNQDFNI